jgi:hypothetical protein
MSRACGADRAQQVLRLLRQQLVSEGGSGDVLGSEGQLSWALSSGKIFLSIILCMTLLSLSLSLTPSGVRG